MRYVLVFQLEFPTQSPEDLDKLLSIEDALIEGIPAPSEVDGHDFGLKEGNIFIFTDEPSTILHAARDIFALDPGLGWKAAYREVDGDSYTILWPPNLTSFCVA